MLGLLLLQGRSGRGRTARRIWRSACRVAVGIVLVAVAVGCQPRRYVAPPRPEPLPPPPSGSPLLDALLKLERGTEWRLVQAVDLSFDAFHPQGLVKIGEELYLSAVEIRLLPHGVGHLFKLDTRGALLAETRLGEGSIYHPGGIDFDGTQLFVPVAEYRPDSRAILYGVAPRTLEVKELLRLNEHIGAVIRDPEAQELIGLSWGSRVLYRFGPELAHVQAVPNRSDFIDYQDCHYIGARHGVCTGLSTLRRSGSGGKVELGGLAVIDLRSLELRHEVPIAVYSPQGHVITRNPAYVELQGDRLRLYAVPDDGKAKLLIYEATVSTTAASTR